MDWPLTFTTQPSTSKLSNNPLYIYVMSTQLKDCYFSHYLTANCPAELWNCTVASTVIHPQTVGVNK